MGTFVDGRGKVVPKGDWAFNVSSAGGAGTTIFSWSFDSGVSYTPIIKASQ